MAPAHTGLPHIKIPAQSVQRVPQDQPVSPATVAPATQALSFEAVEHKPSRLQAVFRATRLTSGLLAAARASDRARNRVEARLVKTPYVQKHYSEELSRGSSAGSIGGKSLQYPRDDAV